MNQPRDAILSESSQGPSGPVEPATRHAVIIGIDTYADERITPLAMAAADAQALYDVLTDPMYGGFAADNVTLLLNEQATYRNIKEAIVVDLVNRAGREDTVVVYYAGHGAPGPVQGISSADAMEKYFVPCDARLDRLRAHGVAMSDIQDWFGFLQTKRVMFFIDSCYSGAAGGRSFRNPDLGTRAVLTDEFLDALSGDGRAVITACDVNQVSLELQDLGHGLFTHYLLEGLKGKADTDGDGRVSLDELYHWLFHQVQAHSRRLGSLMEPIKRGEVKGDIYLTRYENPEQVYAREQCGQAQQAFDEGRHFEAMRLWDEVLLMEPDNAVARAGLERYRQYQREEQDRTYRCMGLLFEWNNAIISSEQFAAASALLKLEPHSATAEQLAKKRALIDLLYDEEPTWDKLAPGLEKILGIPCV